MKINANSIRRRFFGFLPILVLSTTSADEGIWTLDNPPNCLGWRGTLPTQLPSTGGRQQVNPSIPLNFVTTHNITGGNSGSPLINRKLEIVGLVFDSNIHAPPNDYVYSDETARSVSVHSAGILEALSSIYQMDKLVEELKQ